MAITLTGHMGEEEPMLSKHLPGTEALNSTPSLNLPHGLKITLARDPALNNLSHNCRAKIYLTQKSGQSLNLLTFWRNPKPLGGRYKQIRLQTAGLG